MCVWGCVGGGGGGGIFPPGLVASPNDTCFNVLTLVNRLSYVLPSFLKQGCIQNVPLRIFERACELLGEELRSHQHQETHANPTDTRETIEKQTHSNFERRSHQHACFLDCPRARCERTPCLLELNFQNVAFSNVLQTPTRTNRL